MTPGLLPRVTNQILGPFIQMGSIGGKSGLGENVIDTVDGLTHHPILHSVFRMGKLGTCLLVSFAARATFLINGIYVEVGWRLLENLKLC